MAELPKLLDLWPAWVALTVTGLIALNRAIEESGKFAAFLGKWATKRHERALARHHVDLAAAEFADAVKDAIEAARKTWESEENEALTALDKRLETVSEITATQKTDLDELRLQVRALMAYTEYEAAWHHRFGIVVIRHEGNGSCVPIIDIPAHMDYSEFETLYRVNQRWRDWWGLS